MNNCNKNPINNRQAHYIHLRGEALKNLQALDHVRREYEVERQRVLDEMDACFRRRIYDLEDKAIESQDQINAIERAAYRQLQRQRDEILTSRSLNNQEKEKRIRELKQRFAEEVQLNDEYNRYIRKRNAHNILKVLFGDFGSAEEVPMLMDYRQMAMPDNMPIPSTINQYDGFHTPQTNSTIIEEIE